MLKKYPISDKNFHPSILREYDIRGVFEETLFENDAYWIGRCFGQRVKEKSGKAVAVCRDGRLSSPQLADALIQGLCETGVDVYHLGVGPTPMLYFSEYALPVDAAIMVTGSHNPPCHNGFKMSFQRLPFFGDAIQALAQIKCKTLVKGEGQVYEVNLLSSYRERLLQDLEFGKDLSIAWDPGHGATAEVLKKLVQMLPGHHVLLNAEIDGNFPAHSPDPSDPINLLQLQKAVFENKCDLGIAFDGDGDRLVALDSKGRILYGDQLLLLFSKDLLKRKQNATIIADIKVSQAVFDEITSLGGQAIMWKTGHSHIKAKMRESGALLAGEVSGHFFFKEGYYGFDDGLYAAIRLYHLLSHSSQKLVEFYETLPTLPSTAEIRIPCDPDKKHKIPQHIKSRLHAQGYPFNDIDGIRLQLDKGWWLLRASHTQDILVARCESTTTDGLEYIKQHLKNELAKEQIFHSLD